MIQKRSIDKKFIISQTILYITIITFIILFKMIFGEKNTLIGVTSITAIFMFMSVNLTISPGKNTIKLIIINLLTGIGAYLANLNMWGAIPINFIVIFIISYTFYYNLKNPLYLPFSLQYLFLLATPVAKGELTIRLLSLLVAPIAIMLIQLLINKNKITKSGNKIIINICDLIIKKINDNENNEELNINIRKDVNNFRSIVYDNRKDDFYVTEEGRIKLDIVVMLEKLSILLDKESKNKELHNDIIDTLEVIKIAFDNEEKIVEAKNITSNLIREYIKKNKNDFVVFESINCIKILNDSLDELIVLGKENYNKIKSTKKIPEKYKKINVYKKEFYQKSVKFSYAIRVSLGIVIAGFISSYFNLSEGRWIYFTVLSVIIPIYELSAQKTRDRLFATVVGGIIVVILFSIFKDSLSRTLILMFSGYLKSYTTSYRYGTIYTTVSAIGAAALLGGTEVLTINRILFVGLGAVIAIVINKFVLPVKMKDANRELEVMYADAIHEMIGTVYEDTLNESYDSNKIDNLLIVTSMIEERFASNNNALVSQKEAEYLEEERLLVINIHELYTLISNSMIQKIDIKNILQDLKSMVDYEKENMSEVINRVEDHILSTKDINDKVILANIREILIGSYKINKLKKQLSI